LKHHGVAIGYEINNTFGAVAASLAANLCHILLP